VSQRGAIPETGQKYKEVIKRREKGATKGKKKIPRHRSPVKLNLGNDERKIGPAV